MSAPHQRLPWCRCIKDESLTLLEIKWFAMTSTVPSLLPACCCSLTPKPLLSLSVSAPLIFPVSPTHFSCLCHSLHHTLKSSYLIPLPFCSFFSPSWSHDGLHETQCHDYTDTDERWRFLSATSVLNKYCVALLVPHFFFFFFLSLLLAFRFGVTELSPASNWIFIFSLMQNRLTIKTEHPMLLRCDQTANKQAPEKNPYQVAVPGVSAWWPTNRCTPLQSHCSIPRDKEVCNRCPGK